MIAASDDLDRCGPPATVFRCVGLPKVRFELRPVDRDPPARNRVTFLYRRQGDSYSKAGVGHYDEGHWKNQAGKVLDPEGLHWTAMVDES